MQAVWMVCWRLDIAKAITQSKTMWKISKWMRLKSFLKPEIVTILSLGRIEDDTPMTHTHVEKATLLTERFFLSLNVDLSDIANQNFEGEQERQRFELHRSIDIDEVIQIIHQIEVWKVPRNDYLFTGFLKMYGRSLATIIAKITNASFVCEYFPKCLYNADVIVFVKSGKL